MASLGLGSALCPTKPFLFSPFVLGVLPRNLQTKQQINTQFSGVIACCGASSREQLMSGSAAAVTESTDQRKRTTSFGLKNLTETFCVDVHRAEGRALNVTLVDPLTIASSSRLEEVENVAIRVELSNGCVGWGEVQVLPCFNWNQATALENVREACEFLPQGPPVTLNLALDKISKIVPATEFAYKLTGPVLLTKIEFRNLMETGCLQLNYAERLIIKYNIKMYCE